MAGVLESKEGKQNFSQMKVVCWFGVFIVEHQVFIEIVLRTGICVLDGESDCNALS